MTIKKTKMKNEEQGLTRSRKDLTRSRRKKKK